MCERVTLSQTEERGMEKRTVGCKAGPQLGARFDEQLSFLTGNCQSYPHFTHFLL